MNRTICLTQQISLVNSDDSPVIRIKTGNKRPISKNQRSGRGVHNEQLNQHSSLASSPANATQQSVQQSIQPTKVKVSQLQLSPSTQYQNVSQTHSQYDFKVDEYLNIQTEDQYYQSLSQSSQQQQTSEPLSINMADLFGQSKYISTYQIQPKQKVIDVNPEIFKQIPNVAQNRAQFNNITAVSFTSKDIYEQIISGKLFVETKSAHILDIEDLLGAKIFKSMCKLLTYLASPVEFEDFLNAKYHAVSQVSRDHLLQFLNNKLDSTIQVSKIQACDQIQAASIIEQCKDLLRDFGPRLPLRFTENLESAQQIQAERKKRRAKSETNTQKLQNNAKTSEVFKMSDPDAKTQLKNMLDALKSPEAQEQRNIGSVKFEPQAAQKLRNNGAPMQKCGKQQFLDNKSDEIVDNIPMTCQLCENTMVGRLDEKDNASEFTNKDQNTAEANLKVAVDMKPPVAQKPVSTTIQDQPKEVRPTMPPPLISKSKPLPPLPKPEAVTKPNEQSQQPLDTQVQLSEIQLICQRFKYYLSEGYHELDILNNVVKMSEIQKQSLVAEFSKMYNLNLVEQLTKEVQTVWAEGLIQLLYQRTQRVVQCFYNYHKTNIAQYFVVLQKCFDDMVKVQSAFFSQYEEQLILNDEFSLAFIQLLQAPLISCNEAENLLKSQDIEWNQKLQAIFSLSSKKVSFEVEDCLQNIDEAHIRNLLKITYSFLVDNDQGVADMLKIFLHLENHDDQLIVQVSALFAEQIQDIKKKYNGDIETDLRIAIQNPENLEFLLEVWGF